MLCVARQTKGALCVDNPSEQLAEQKPFSELTSANAVLALHFIPQRVVEWHYSQKQAHRPVSGMLLSAEQCFLVFKCCQHGVMTRGDNAFRLQSERQRH